MFRLTAIISFCFGVFQQVCGQQYRIENITNENGLISNRVLELFQHENGDVWIGTQDGISVFDGIEFKSIRQEDGLPVNTVFSIASMPDNKIAVGTLQGLAIIHGKKITVIDSASGLPANLIRKVKYIKDRLWISTEKGLITLKGDSLIAPDFGQLNTNKPVVDIVEDPWGRIWFATGGTIDYGDGAFVWDGKEIFHINKAKGLASSRVTRVFFNGEKTWVCAFAGVSIFDKNFNLDTTLVSMGVPKEFYAHCLDAEGKLWSAGFDYAIYQPVEAGFDSVAYNPEYFLNVFSMLGDSEGNVWCGSRDNGVTKISLKPFHNYNMESGLSSKGINRFAAATDSTIYVANDSGLDLFHTQKMKAVKTLVPNTKVRSVLVNNGNVWLGLNDYYGVAKISSEKTEYFLSNIEETERYVSDVAFYKDSVFVSSSKGLGVIDKGLIRYLDFHSGSKGKHVNQLLKDTDGGLLLAMNESGLKRYMNGATEQVQSKVGEQIRHLYFDRKDKLWCVSNKGLFYRKNNEFHQVSTESIGALEGGFYSIIQDNDSTFWLGMSSGVCRLTFKGDSLVRLRNYGVNDGFLMDCNPRAVHKDNHGRIWFGTNGGVNIYYPQYDRINTLPPLLRLTEVLLFQTETDWGPYAQVTFDGLPISPELPYDKNHISIRFKGVTHVNPEEVVYRYRLVGQTNTWITTKERKADFNNLSHGKYRFEVTCTNKDGYSNDAPIVFEFVINPPFWQTWWFYMLIILIISGAVYSYFRIRNANKKISRINEELNTQKEIISAKNKDIMDSIHYAKRIQDAVLPSADVLEFPNTFVYFRPKDVVSGDFYWFYNLNGVSLFAAADCTGHGVPGAFMSIIGYNLLDKIVGEYNILAPAAILDKLNDEISRTLHQKSSSGAQIRDGMDMSLVCYNQLTNELQFAGAINPLWLMRDGKIEIIKGDRMPIGTQDIYEKRYTNHSIQIRKGDSIYLHTDGIVDQFGQRGGGKFKTRRLKDLLEKLQELPIHKQKAEIDAAFIQWKGDEEQLDDILVIGCSFE